MVPLPAESTNKAGKKKWERERERQLERKKERWKKKNAFVGEALIAIGVCRGFVAWHRPRDVNCS
jgi:hypothetical protein